MNLLNKNSQHYTPTLTTTTQICKVDVIRWGIRSVYKDAYTVWGYLKKGVMMIIRIRSSRNIHPLISFNGISLGESQGAGAGVHHDQVRGSSQG